MQLVTANAHNLCHAHAQACAQTHVLCTVWLLPCCWSDYSVSASGLLAGKHQVAVLCIESSVLLLSRYQYISIYIYIPIYRYQNISWLLQLSACQGQGLVVSILFRNPVMLYLSLFALLFQKGPKRLMLLWCACFRGRLLVVYSLFPDYERVDSWAKRIRFYTWYSRSKNVITHLEEHK